MGKTHAERRHTLPTFMHREKKIEESQSDSQIKEKLIHTYIQLTNTYTQAHNRTNKQINKQTEQKRKQNAEKRQKKKREREEEEKKRMIKCLYSMCRSDKEAALTFLLLLYSSHTRSYGSSE